MDLGRQAGARTRHSLGGLAASRIGSVRVHTHRSAIDHETFVITMGGAQSEPDRLPQAVFGPSAKPIIHRRPATERCRQVTPRRARAQDPEDRLDSQPQIPAAPASSLGPAEAVPMGLNFFSSSQPLSAKTNLDCCFTTRSKQIIRSKSSTKYSIITYFTAIYYPDTP